MAEETVVKRPSALLGMTEPLRAAVDLASLLPGSLWLGAAPRGDGHRVLVLPGFTGSDRSTLALRVFLRRQGFDARGWGLGPNLGGPEQRDDLKDLLRRMLAESAEPISLVGWSLGGLLARNLARRQPAAIRSLITLGSPIGGSPTRTRAWRLYRQIHDQQNPAAVARFAASVRRDPPENVPSTAIWSRGDGIVPWQISCEEPGPQRENLEVWSSHLGLGVNAAVLYALADRLSQPREGWQPFETPWWLRPVLRPVKV